MRFVTQLNEPGLGVDIEVVETVRTHFYLDHFILGYFPEVVGILAQNVGRSVVDVAVVNDPLHIREESSHAAVDMFPNVPIDRLEIHRMDDEILVVGKSPVGDWMVE